MFGFEPVLQFVMCLSLFLSFLFLYVSLIIFSLYLILTISPPIPSPFHPIPSHPIHSHSPPIHSYHTALGTHINGLRTSVCSINDAEAVAIDRAVAEAFFHCWQDQTREPAPFVKSPFRWVDEGVRSEGWAMYGESEESDRL
jgi:hypothetical protein